MSNLRRFGRVADLLVAVMFISLSLALAGASLVGA